MNLLLWIAFLLLIRAKTKVTPTEALLQHSHKSDMELPSQFRREVPPSGTSNIKETTFDYESANKAVPQIKEKKFKLSTTAILGLIGLMFGIIAFASYLRYKYNHRTSYNL